MTDTPNTTQGKRAVDWTKPIVGVNGTPATVNNTFEDGMANVIIDGGCWSYMPDGQHYRGQHEAVRNVPEHPTPTQYAPELVERMVALVRDADALAPNDGNKGYHPADAWRLILQARFIVSDLPQEVDPDLIAVRNLLAEHGFIADEDAYGITREVAAAALALGRQLERGETA